MDKKETKGKPKKVIKKIVKKKVITTQPKKAKLKLKKDVFKNIKFPIIKKKDNTNNNIKEDKEKDIKVDTTKKSNSFSLSKIFKSKKKDKKKEIEILDDKKEATEEPKVKKPATPTVWAFRGVILAIALGILLLSYMLLGFELTIAVALLMLIAVGVGFLLSKIKNESRRRKIISLLLIFVLICGIAGLSAFCAFMVYIKKEAEPKYENAKLNTMEVSRLYDKDGVEFAKIGEENREKVKYEQLPEVLVDAIIATEDARFFTHNGFDAPRFLKAFIGQLTNRAGAGGASTLTMQVVKNSFTDKYGEKTSGLAGIVRKFEDIYLAVFKLEKDYSKQEIVEYYVNNHFLGGNTYGVQEASIAYFGKSVTDLNLSEAAILAGMFKSPNAYKPTTNPENAAARRKTVLRLMRKHGYITEEEEELANSIPVESLAYSGTNSNANKYQGYIDTVVDELKERFGVNPYTTPLLVYTNLDRGRQDAVISVMNGEAGFDWKDGLIQGGVAVVDSHTGKILAIGNGRNRDNSVADQFNFATEIRRQPGSTAKPLFDYGPGIEYNNWSTAQIFDDAPYTYSNGRPISNWDNGYYGQLTLRGALKDSRNIPALKAFQQVDQTNMREFVTGLGVEPEICAYGYIYNFDTKKCHNENDSSDTQEPTGIHEAHAIGAFTGVSPLIMAGAYAAFSNGGYYHEPYSVTKIVYRQSKEEVEVHPIERQVMSDATAFMISSVLQNVALSGGTPYNVAAKTGTTNYDDNTMYTYNMPGDAVRDSWVVGYSTRTVIAVWYGYDSLTKDQIAEGYISHMTEATIAKDFFFNALVSAGAMEWDREAFQQPSSVVSVAVSKNNCNPPKLAIPGTDSITELFKKGFEPTEYDTSNYKLPAPGNFKATPGTGKVTLTWNAVDPSVLASSSHGNFGYNVYKDNKLLGWTDKTSYVYTGANIYGTYRVYATYKDFTEVQSESASTTLKEPEEDPTPKPTTPSPSPSTEPSPSPSTEPKECPADANKKDDTCECKDKGKTFDESEWKCK